VKQIDRQNEEKNHNLLRQIKEANRQTERREVKKEYSWKRKRKQKNRRFFCG
jgi:hypothetical protein